MSRHLWLTSCQWQPFRLFQHSNSTFLDLGSKKREFSNFSAGQVSLLLIFRIVLKTLLLDAVHLFYENPPPLSISRTLMTGRLFCLLHRQPWASNTLKKGFTKTNFHNILVIHDAKLITLIQNLVASSLDINAPRKIDTPDKHCWF